MVVRSEGRVNGQLEFVEFAVTGKGSNFVTQQGEAERWYVFQVGIGGDGKPNLVTALESFGPDQRTCAEKAARVAAELFDQWS